MLRIKKGGYKEMHDYYIMMQEDFNKDLLPPEIVFHKAMFQNQIDLLLIADDNIKVTVAYAVVCPKSLYNYGFVWYFAVLPWYRGKGLGVESMKLIHRRYGKMGGMMVEINENDDADAQIAFFTKMGYKPVKCGAYTHSGVRSRIMVRRYEGSPDPAPIMHRLLPEIYSHLFSETTVGKMISIQPLKKKKLFG